MHVVHMFVGHAAAPEDNEWGYPCGERHGILLFCRRPTGSEYDSELAYAEVEDFGWTDVVLKKVGVADPKRALTRGENFDNAYHTALQTGRAIIIYEDGETEGL